MESKGFMQVWNRHKGKAGGGPKPRKESGGKVKPNNNPFQILGENDGGEEKNREGNLSEKQGIEGTEIGREDKQKS